MDAYLFDKGFSKGLFIIVRDHGLAVFEATDIISASSNAALVVNCKIYSL